jgi:hypothetical protein
MNTTYNTNWLWVDGGILGVYLLTSFGLSVSSNFSINKRVLIKELKPYIFIYWWN